MTKSVSEAQLGFVDAEAVAGVSWRRFRFRPSLGRSLLTVSARGSRALAYRATPAPGLAFASYELARERLLAMASVLVVDDDVQLRNALARDLRTQGYEVRAAATCDEALQRLGEDSYDVLLTDLRLSGEDGMDLITQLPEKAPETRPILMSAYATAKDSQRATELGVVSVLCKPFGVEELVRAVEQAIDCSTGFRGSIHGLSLVDILQMFHYGKRSITLRLAGSVPAKINIDHGEVVHAERGTEIGEAALKGILTVPTGSLKTNALEVGETTIQRSFQSLLLDLLRELDEQHQKSIHPEGKGGDSLFGDLFQPQASSGEQTTENSAQETTMGTIDEACKNVVERVEGAVACGVVDLDTGMLLGIFNSAGYTQTLNEIVAAATMDLFRGPNVGKVEQMVREHRGEPEDGSHYFEEVQISSKHNMHFAKTLKDGKAVIMLVTKKTTNLGLGWAQLKEAIPDVEPLVP